MKITLILVIGIISSLIYGKFLSRNANCPLFTIGFYFSLTIPVLAIPSSLLGFMPTSETVNTIIFMTCLLSLGLIISIYFSIKNYILYKKTHKTAKRHELLYFLLFGVFGLEF